MRGHVTVMTDQDFAAWLAASPSSQTLDEEGSCDKQLTKVAQTVNRAALEEFGHPEESEE